MSIKLFPRVLNLHCACVTCPHSGLQSAAIFRFGQFFFFFFFFFFFDRGDGVGGGCCSLLLLIKRLNKCYESKLQGSFGSKKHISYGMDTE